MRAAREHRYTVLILGMLTLYVGGWLTSAYLRYRRSALSPWRDPKTVLDWSKIDPHLALRELEGDLPRDIFWIALEARDITTAYATLTYAVDLDPQERYGLWLVLAQRARGSAHRAMRRICYSTAAAVVTLAPELSDLTRAQTLLTAAQGMADLGATMDALFYLDQVYAVVHHGDRLTRAHRRAIMDQSLALHQALGRELGEWHALVDREPGSVLLGQPSSSRSVKRPGFMHLSDRVIQATVTRQWMVQQVLQTTGANRGAFSRDQLDDLASVLLNEDTVRQQSYAALGPEHQIDLARDQVAWMILKSRVAHKGFGLGIVPEWEQQVTEIDARLRFAQDTFYTQYQELLGLDQERTILLAKVEQGLLGFYPDWPRKEWASQLVSLVPTRTLYVTGDIQDQNVRFSLAGLPDS